MSVFKAYDVRGVYPDQIDADLARGIGTALANLLSRTGEGDAALDPATCTIGVGRDARPSGEPLGEALIEGVRAAGANVVNVGMVTTPMLYFAVGELGLTGGVIVTASHNPPEYNGMKLTREQAIPMSYHTGIADVEQRIAQSRLITGLAETHGLVSHRDIIPRYHDFMAGFAVDTARRRLRAVIDNANGVAALDGPLFERLNLDVTELFFDIDGTYPNHEANPILRANIAECIDKVKETGADLGIAFDGDADRVVFIDEHGEPVRPDLVTALIADALLEREPGAAILYDLRSSWAVREAIEKKGGKPIRDRVGHSYMKATMRQEGCVFGGELSGHYYWRATYTADSPMLTLIELLNRMRATGKPLSELVAPFCTYHATGERNYHVADKEAAIERLATLADGAIFHDHLDGITVEYPDWWFNVRKSNTETLLRLNLEVRDKAALADHLKTIESLIDGTLVDD